MNEPTDPAARLTRRVGIALMLLWVILLEVVVFMWIAKADPPMFLIVSSFAALAAGVITLAAASVMGTRRRSR